MSKFCWKETVVVVTGASSGIGRATAVRLAREGAYLALAARRRAELETLALEVQALGGQALVQPTDVACPEQIQALVQAVLQRWGRIDVLISNAGQYIQAPILRMNVDCLEQSMAVNFYSGVHITRAVLPCMLDSRKGHIVLVNSMDAKKGIPSDAPYVAAKCALMGFSEILRQELYGTGVEVTSVYPGRIDTPMIDHLRVPSISAKVPPEAVARAIQKGVEGRKAEVYLPAQTKFLYYANVFSPRLADWFVRRFGLAGEEMPD